MKLTPLDIRHKEFRRAMRGYSDEEVDVFLDEVADEFERLFQQNLDAEERIQRLEQHVAQYEQLKETLQATLITAQQQADEMRSNARKEAELILKDSELKGRDLVGEAYTEKQRVQQSLIQLRQAEEDFRFKFRSLLEAHLNLLAEDEVSEDRRQFRGLVESVEQELEGPAAPVTPSPFATRPPSEERVAAVWAEASPAAVVDPTIGSAADAPAVVVPADSSSTVPAEEDEAAAGGGETTDEAAFDEAPPSSGVRRFLFGHKDRDEVLPADEPEDREFKW